MPPRCRSSRSRSRSRPRPTAASVGSSSFLPPVEHPSPPPAPLLRFIAILATSVADVQLLFLALLSPLLLRLGAGAGAASDAPAHSGCGPPSPPSLRRVLAAPGSRPVDRVLLVTAHPDDETMFFAPTVLRRVGGCGVGRGDNGLTAAAPRTLRPLPCRLGPRSRRLFVSPSPSPQARARGLRCARAVPDQRRCSRCP